MPCAPRRRSSSWPPREPRTGSNAEPVEQAALGPRPETEQEAPATRRGPYPPEVPEGAVPDDHRLVATICVPRQRDRDYAEARTPAQRRLLRVAAIEYACGTTGPMWARARKATSRPRPWPSSGGTR